MVHYIRLTGRLAVLIAFLFIGLSQPALAQKSPKNLILFISDGLGPAGVTMARDYSRDVLGQPDLTLDPYLVGSARTRSTSNRVTDSAAGATAFAAGQKSYNGAISVDDDRQPIGTILEAAEARGMATGLVATSAVTHATPAAFSAHVPDRDMEVEIASQQVAQGIDVIFGGGLKFYTPLEKGGARQDGKDLVEVARASGTQILGNANDLNGKLRLPVLGLFASGHMAYEIDRHATQEPSLAEMTARAIELLKSDRDGFFLMVEGSKIDHAGHANDPAAELHDILAYQEAVARALEFARKDGNTLVLAVSDHETGGITIGSDYQWEPSALSKVRASKEVIVSRVRQAPDQAEQIIRDLTGITDLKDAELAALKEAVTDGARLNRFLTTIVTSRARLGFVHGGHTGVDVNVYAFGPGRDRFVGNRENDEIGRILAQLFRFDLKRRTAGLRARASSK